jgi:methyl-accepting chemotaxis protein
VRKFNPFVWLRNRRIITKLFLMMIFMLALLVGVGLEGYLSMSRVKTQLDTLATTMESGQSISHLRSVNLQADRLQKNYILAGSPKERERIMPELEDKVLDMDGASRAFLRFFANPAQETKFREEIMPLIEEWTALNDDILALVEQNKTQEALALSNTRGVRLMTTIVDVKIDELITLSEKEVDRQKKLAQAEFQNSLIQLLVSIGIALALAMAIAFLFARQIAAPLHELIAMLRDIAEGEGDLSKTLNADRHDEIGELALWFNRFLAQLRGMVSQIDSVSSRLQESSQALAQSADETGTGAHQVSRTMEQLAIGVTEQVQGITKSSDEALAVANAAEKVSSNVAIAAQSSQQAAAAAAAGDRVLQDALSHMDAVQGVFTDSAEVVERLGALSQQIQAIVTLIGGFAKKTNLLALNAGIEAARVGNQGLAFSVLAQEIRKLAVESGNAAQHIAELVSNIHDETQRAVSIMHQGSQGVTQGVEIIHEAGDAFDRVVSAIERTDREIQQIREAARQLATSAEVMVREMDAIANISEESAAGAEEVAATSHQQTASVERVSGSAQGLTKLSTELRSLVTRFTL